MAARKVNHAARSAILEFIREHEKDYTDGVDAKSDIVRLAFESFYHDKIPVNLNSSTVSRYWTLATTGEPPKQSNLLRSPLDIIHEAERKIEGALQELDAERNRLSNRIKEIDNTVARYTKFLANGHDER